MFKLANRFFLVSLSKQLESSDKLFIELELIFEPLPEFIEFGLNTPGSAEIPAEPSNKPTGKNQYIFILFNVFLLKFDCVTSR